MSLNNGREQRKSFRLQQPKKDLTQRLFSNKCKEIIREIEYFKPFTICHLVCGMEIVFHSKNDRHKKMVSLRIYCGRLSKYAIYIVVDFLPSFIYFHFWASSNLQSSPFTVVHDASRTEGKYEWKTRTKSVWKNHYNLLLCFVIRTHQREKWDTLIIRWMMMIFAEKRFHFFSCSSLLLLSLDRNHLASHHRVYNMIHPCTLHTLV